MPECSAAVPAATAPGFTPRACGADAAEDGGHYTALRAVETSSTGTHAVDDLIRNKRAAGRTKDLADVETLESLKR